jgi:hypothetical protein
VLACENIETDRPPLRRVLRGGLCQGSFKDPKFRRNFNMDWIPGWELPASWDVERYNGPLPPDVPTDGQLQVNFRTTHENHRPNPKIRAWVQEQRTLLAIPPPRLDGRIKYLA